MNKDSQIAVLGATGLVGSAIVRKLKELGYKDAIGFPHGLLDLQNQNAVNIFFETIKPEYVFMAAAKVGGIAANIAYKGEFIYNNLIMAINVIHAAYSNGAKKLLFLGSNCIYPKNAKNPISENSFLSGELEPTNEPYAIAKIAAIKMCEAYRDQYGFNAISAMPCNLMGIGDHYDLEKSHVLPALILKIHEAKIKQEPTVTVWGDGLPRREILYSDDCADACIFLMNNYDGKEIINIGSGEDFRIEEIAKIICDVIGYDGRIVYDTSKPNGTEKKLLDSSKINKLGWHPSTTLIGGIKKTYEDFKQRYGSIK